MHFAVIPGASRDSIGNETRHCVEVFKARGHMRGVINNHASRSSCRSQNAKYFRNKFLVALLRRAPTAQDPHIHGIPRNCSDIWIRSGVRSTKLAARREQQGAQGSTRHKRSAPGNICIRARPTNQDPLVRLMNSFGQKCHASWQLSPLFCPLPCFFEKSSIADWSFPCSGARS